MERPIPSPEQRLYDAAVRWSPAADAIESADIIDAAAQALVDGLDSPSLRILAGASAADRIDEIRLLLNATLDELGIPSPGTLPPWTQIASGGQLYSRLPSDSIRFDIVRASREVGGFEVLVYVNGVEMTSNGAGRGMDPFDVLIPTNRLVATPEPLVVPIARCGCGVYGCGSTDVSILRDGDTVHWDWLLETPMEHGVSFLATQYDTEVARIRDDHSWERPEDTTARLILERVDHQALADFGMTISWAAKDHRDGRRFVVALFIGNDLVQDTDYQVFLRFRWQDRNPTEVADEVAHTLQRPPKKWRATFHSTRPQITAPPSLAGRTWRRESGW